MPEVGIHLHKVRCNGTEPYRVNICNCVLSNYLTASVCVSALVLTRALAVTKERTLYRAACTKPQVLQTTLTAGTVSIKCPAIARYFKALN